MSTEPTRLPVSEPRRNPETERFWHAASEGRIELPVCDGCGLVVWYPRAICPDCHSTELTWTEMAGTGTVYSYSVTHAGVGRRWREHLPFVVAYVELDEGPRILTNIVDTDPATVEIGMAVTAVFDPTDEGEAILRFKGSSR